MECHVWTLGKGVVLSVWSHSVSFSHWFHAMGGGGGVICRVLDKIGLVDSLGFGIELASVVPHVHVLEAVSLGLIDSNGRREIGVSTFAIVSSFIPSEESIFMELESS